MARTTPQKYRDVRSPQQRHPDPDADYVAVLLEFRRWAHARGQPFRREMLRAMRAHMEREGEAVPNNRAV